MRYEYRTNEITEALIENGDAVSEHGAAHIHELVKHVSNLQSRIAELEQDNQEQCRLNAMGAEREARLMARVKELEKDAARYHKIKDAIYSDSATLEFNDEGHNGALSFEMWNFWPDKISCDTAVDLSVVIKD